MVVALIALFVSLGGVSYGVATGSITSKAIKNGTIRGKDVKANTLTGTRIKESSLRRVKRAKRADTLGNLKPTDVLTRGFVGVKQGEVGFTGNYTRVANLALPAGPYIVIAKAEVSSTASAPLTANCKLQAESDRDDTRSQLISNGIGADPQKTTTLMVPHIAKGGFNAVLDCKAEGEPGLNLFRNPPFTQAGRVKIVAIRTDSMDSQRQP